MSLSESIGNEQKAATLRKIARAGRLPNLLIFGGPSGVGKYQCAIMVARYTNCTARNDDMACGLCPNCRSIDAGINPDIVTITRLEGKKDIAKEQIATIFDALKYPPIMLPHRFVLIDNAESLNRASANAMLKILEEPAAKNTFILITDRLDRLMPTIRSRGWLFHFGPLSEREIVSSLTTNYPDIADDRAELIAKLAYGSTTVATTLAHDERLFELRDRIIAILSENEGISALSALREFLFGKSNHLDFQPELILIVASILRDIVLDGISGYDGAALTSKGSALINSDLGNPTERYPWLVKNFDPTEFLFGLAHLADSGGTPLNKQLAFDALSAAARR